MNITEHCASYDAAEAAAKASPIGPWISNCEHAKAALVEHVNKAMGLMRYQIAFNRAGLEEATATLAYFSAWAIMRGGFTP